MTRVHNNDRNDFEDEARGMEKEGNKFEIITI